MRAVVAGMVLVFSPLYLTGGLSGWREHYDPKLDVLLRGWFASSVASVIIGLALLIGGGLIGIWIGLGVGLFAILRGRRMEEPGKPPQTKLKALGAATGPTEARGLQRNNNRSDIPRLLETSA